MSMATAAGWNREMISKARRQDSDDLVHLAVDLDRAPHEPGISAVSPLPQLVGDDCCFRSLESLLFGRKVTAESRVDAEEREEVRRDR